jgi:hypothetical protein
MFVRETIIRLIGGLVAAPSENVFDFLSPRFAGIIAKGEIGR